MGNKRKKTETLPARMGRDERPLIKKAARIASLSESRFLVTAGLLLSDFETEEQLRTALRNGRQLVETRTMAVMQVRRISNQLKELKSKQDTENLLCSAAKIDKALDEVTATMEFLRESWQGRSRK